MKTPMLAQIIGDITNIILDWLLILGIGISPELGIAGAEIATVIVQIVAAIFTSIKASIEYQSFQKHENTSTKFITLVSLTFKFHIEGAINKLVLVDFINY